MKLRKLGGNWYCDAKRTAKSYDTVIYYEINGVIFSAYRALWSIIDDAERWQSWVSSREDQIEKLLRAQASTGDKYYTAVLERVDAQQPVTPTGTPQISTEVAEAVNVLSEEDKREIKHISAIIETCRLHDDNGEMTDEYKYYNWLAYVNCVSYQTIAEKALTEAWINIFQAAYRRGKGHVLAMNKLGELVDIVFTSSVQPVGNSDNLQQPLKSVPQSRKVSPVSNYVTPTLKTRETARKRPNSAVRKFCTTHTICARLRKWTPANSPPTGRSNRIRYTGSIKRIFITLQKKYYGTIYLQPRFNFRSKLRSADAGHQGVFRCS